MPAQTAVAVLANLPPDSALARVDQPWTFDQHLSVAALEHLSMFIRLYLVHSAGIKKRHLPDALHIPRPGELAKPSSPAGARPRRAAPKHAPAKGLASWANQLIDHPGTMVVTIGDG